MTCARCRRAEAVDGTRCPECREKDRKENGARYVKRGGRGGLRQRIEPTVEREGDTVRIVCSRCKTRIAGTFDAEDVMRILAEHKHPTPRRGRVMPERQGRMW